MIGALRQKLARLRDRNLHTWMAGYAAHLGRRVAAGTPPAHRHLIFAVCDHYEPHWGKPEQAVAEARVEAWRVGYPEMAAEARDASGRPPQHSFFFPGEEYQPGYLDALAELAAAGFGEVELHLHHDDDTADNLRETIERYLEIFAGHGHLSRDAAGRPRYAFIHGNWCLANSRPDGTLCGVDAELPLLFETGCYADFTFPSAPDVTQPNLVNQIYWPTGDLSRRAAHRSGEPARVGERKDDRLLMIPGPLSLAKRPGKLSVRIENGALTGDDPPTIERAASWVDQAVGVRGRPEWVFVKVHTHGAPEHTGPSYLGDDGRRFHRELVARYNDGERWTLHYVTAREMFNIACAAMDGHDGDPDDYRDHLIGPPPVAGR